MLFPTMRNRMRVGWKRLALLEPAPMGRGVSAAAIPPALLAPRSLAGEPMAAFLSVLPDAAAPLQAREASLP